MRISILLALLILCGSNISFAQDDFLESYDHLGLNIKFGTNIPGGDYADRFGMNTEAGIGLEYFFNERNLVFSVEADAFFGNEVKEDVIANLRLDNGQILAVSGRYGSVFMRQRATYFGAMLEKLLSRNPHKRGIKAGLGIGFFTHRIRFLNDTNDIPQVRGEYAKGYDHKSQGPALREKLSYNYINNSRKIFFTVGFEFTQAFTKNIRAINFDSYTAEDEARLDLMFGLNIKWTLPLKTNKPLEDIYY